MDKADPGEPPATRSALRWVGVAVLAMECVALSIAAGGYAVYAIAGGGDVRGRATLLAVFAAVLAIGVGVAARGFGGGRRWSHGAAVTWQVLQLAIAVTVWPAQPLVATALVAASVLVVIAVVVAARRQAEST